jgi:hypothetical protein
MPSETSTPNIGLQIPALNQSNWQVPTNYNWNLLDLIFGGQAAVPALAVTNLTVANIAALLAAAFVAEVPAGSLPGSAFTPSHTPGLVLGFFVNGLFQRPGTDYTLTSGVIYVATALAATDNPYILYM